MRPEDSCVGLWSLRRLAAGIDLPRARPCPAVVRARRRRRLPRPCAWSLRVGTRDGPPARRHVVGEWTHRLRRRRLGMTNTSTVSEPVHESSSGCRPRPRTPAADHRRGGRSMNGPVAMQGATMHTGSLGSTTHAIRADADTVAELAAIDWSRHFRPVCLDPVRGLITLMSPLSTETACCKGQLSLRRAVVHRGVAGGGPAGRSVQHLAREPRPDHPGDAGHGGGGADAGTSRGPRRCRRSCLARAEAAADARRGARGRRGSRCGAADWSRVCVRDRSRGRRPRRSRGRGGRRRGSGGSGRRGRGGRSRCRGRGPPCRDRPRSDERRRASGQALAARGRDPDPRRLRDGGAGSGVCGGTLRVIACIETPDCIVIGSKRAELSLIPDTISSKS